MNTEYFLSVSGSDPAVAGDPVSAGDALPESVEDVSSGDSFPGSAVSISSDDSGPGSDPMETVTEVDVISEGSYEELLFEVKSINYLISALLFFTIFVWVEVKVRSIVRKVMKHE